MGPFERPESILIAGYGAEIFDVKYFFVENIKQIRFNPAVREFFTLRWPKSYVANSNSVLNILLAPAAFSIISIKFQSNKIFFYFLTL